MHDNLRVPYATIGGIWGHILRRVIHVSMILIPLIYYHVTDNYFHDGVRIERIILLITLLVILLIEALRIKFGLAIIGHREHERNNISTACWGLVSIIIIFLFLSGSEQHAISYALPLIGGCALGDPWMGELRMFHVNNKIIIISATIIIAALWLLCSYIFHTPWWYALFAAPLAVVGEYFKFSWIDDNATMMLLPLVALLAVMYVS
jgi:hypothetical protein